MVMLSSFVPERGDVIWICLNPQSGHEQSGRRPALVISPSSYNKKVGLAIVCPITTQIKGYPFEVFIPETEAIKGVILADQVKNLDWKARKAKFVTHLPRGVIQEVLSRLNALII